jgi:hypothetical protein
MANCVNINSKEFKTLVAQSNMNPLVLAAKISLWQDTFGVENFPTFEELFEKSAEVETDSLPIKPGVEELFNENPELTSVGSQEQYSQYLNTIFPDSQVKDIVYHGTNNIFESFSKSKLGESTTSPSAYEGFFFTNNIELANYYSGKNDLELTQNMYTPTSKYKDTITDEDIDFSGKLNYIETNDINTLSYKYDTNSKLFKVRDVTIKDIDESTKYLNKEDFKKRYGVLLKVTLEAKRLSIGGFSSLGNTIAALEEGLIETVDTKYVILDLKNPTILDDEGVRGFSKSDDKNSTKESYYERLIRAKENNKDGLVMLNTLDPFLADIFVVFELEQIHILGSKQDIQGFKEFVSNRENEIETDSLDIPMTYVNTKVVEELNSLVDPRDAAEVKEKIGNVVDMLLGGQDNFFTKLIKESYTNEENVTREVLKEVVYLVNDGVEIVDSFFDTRQEAYDALRKLQVGLELEILNASFLYGKNSKEGLMRVDPEYLRMFSFSLFSIDIHPQGMKLMIVPSRNLINASAKYPTLSLKNNTFRNYYNLLMREQIDNLSINGELTEENYNKLINELGDVSNQSNTPEENFVIAKAPYQSFSKKNYEQYGFELETDSLPITNNSTQTAMTLLSVTRLEELGKRKTSQIRIIQNKINNLKGIERASSATNKIKIKKEIALLKRVEKQLEEDLNKYKKITDVEAILRESFNKDVQDAMALLQNPSLTNLYLAKDIFKFLQRTFNVSIQSELGKDGQPKDMNKSTIFVLDDANQAYPAELTGLLAPMRGELDKVSKEIYKAENKVFISLLEKQQPILSKLYPGKTNEEIRATLLERMDYSAIDKYASLFLPRGRTVENQDAIGQLERLEYLTEESRASSEVAELKNKLEAMKDRVSKRLLELGYKTVQGLPDFHKVFITKKSNGEIEYVSRFTERWSLEIASVFKTFYDEIGKVNSDRNLSKELKRQAKERANNDKFKKLRGIADFVDFRYLPEIYDNTELGPEFENSAIDDGGVYKKQLIDKIGEEAYREIVDRQLLSLYNFEEQKKAFLEAEKAEKEVDDISELSSEEQAYIQAVIDSKNPLYFLKNYRTNENNVFYQQGSSTFALKSDITNNTFIPKDPAYYNPQYDEIKKDKLLYDFLNTVKESQRYVAEAGVQTKPKSMFFMAKKAKEMYTAPWYNPYKAFLQGYHNIKDKDVFQFLRNFFSDREQNINEKSQITFFNGEVSGNLFDRVQEIANLDLTKISTILKLPVALAFKEKKQVFYIRKHQTEELQAIADVLEVSPNFLKEIAEKRYVDFTDAIATVLKSSGNTIRQLVDTAYEGETVSLATVQGNKQLKVALAMKETFYVSDLVSIFQNKAIEEQTYDIVTMQKLALSMAADFKAKTYVKNLMESLTEDLAKVSYGEGPNSNNPDNNLAPRQFASEAQDAFKRSVVFGKRANVWGYNFTKSLFEKDGEIKKFFGAYSRNLTKEDKKLYLAYEQRVIVLDELTEKVKNSLLSKEDKDKLIRQFITEKERIDDIITSMGIDYRISSPLNNMISKGFIAVKMAYSFQTAMVMNKFQAWIQAMAKSGRTDSEGNLISGHYSASALQMAYLFISPGFLLSTYERARKSGFKALNSLGADISQDTINNESTERGKQLKIMAILIESLNVVQDGTDLLAKAERPIIGKAPTLLSKSLITKGMYIHEWAEYNNQVPLILATMYEQKLEDGTRVFDGTSFPIYETDSETLRLKPQYRTPENIEKYEKWIAPESLAYISTLRGDVIPRRNGDYTYSAFSPIQRTYLGTSLLALKRYLSMMIFDAWSKPQADLVGGQVKGGYLRTLAEGNAFTRGQLISTLTTSVASSVIMGGFSLGVLKSLGIGAVAVVGLPVAIMGAASIYGAKMTVNALSKNNKKEDKSIVNNFLGMGTQTLTGLYSVVVPILQTINAMTLMINDKSYLKEVDWTIGGKLTDAQADASRTAAIQQGISLMTMLLYGLVVALMDSPDDDEEKETREKLAIEQGNRIKENETETAVRRAILNALARMQEDSQIGVNFDKEVMALAGGDKQSLFVPGVGLTKGIFHLYSGDYHQGVGMYYGDSKASVEFRKALLPIAIRNIDKEGWRAGLEVGAEKMVKNTNKIYQANQTEFKVQKREINKIREKLKIRLTNELYPNYSELTAEEQAKAKKVVQKETNKLLPIPSRDLYDVNQKVKDPEIRKLIEESMKELD